MKSRPFIILLVIFVVVAVTVFVFVLPGIAKRDAHLKADKLFDDGLACEFHGDYVCASDNYQQAIAVYGQDSRYYVYLAQLQIRQGDYSDGIANYQKAKAIDPTNESILPAMQDAIHQQATQTALSLTVSQESAPVPGVAGGTTVRATPLPEAVYPIFDEDFGIVKSVFAVSESSDDAIKYEVVDNEAYAGKYSMLITWQKFYQHWASLILAFDSDTDLQRAAAGQMVSINLSPPSDYAIQFFAKRETPFVANTGSTLMDDSITLKFQDQNLLFGESLGNQAVYIYKLDPNYDFIPDGRLPLVATGWQEFCLPLDKFDTDYWIKQEYANYSPAERQLDWANVKQINIDANFYSTNGSVYIDAMRVIRASDCTPYP